MKKIILLFLVAALAVSLTSFLWWSSASNAPTNDQAQVRFVIPKGQPLGKIAERLKEEGLVKNKLTLKLYLQFQGLEEQIKAGDYRLARNLNLYDIVRVLLAGPRGVWVTYPEGIRREEFASKTAEALEIQDAAFLDEFLALTEGKEGTLFPDTYLFEKETPVQTIVGKLTSTFEQKLSKTLLDEAEKQGLSKNELVILASIVEKETRGQEERPIVAGILLKRLKNSWPLQADATLQYAVANQRCYPRDTLDICGADFKWWIPPTVEDKKVASPYNTYLHRGFPPFPIASPGLSSIKAASSPEDSPYWFYLHDREGKIHYAKTTEEHNENIAKYILKLAT